nr:MAG TPA: hypothetical protein [Caudoviricetes sp.]
MFCITILRFLMLQFQNNIFLEKNLPVFRINF